MPTPCTVENVFKESQRLYVVEGVDGLFTSVTTVLNVINKPFLLQFEKKKVLSLVQDSLSSVNFSDVNKSEEDFDLWKSNFVENITTESRRNDHISIGNRSHSLIEDLLASREINITKEDGPRIESIMNAFHDWRALNSWPFLDSERPVYSIQHKFAGTIDAVFGFENRGVILVDWKTSNAIYPEYAFQLAAYAQAFEEMEDVPVLQLWVVRFDKTNGNYEMQRVDRELAWQGFQSCLSTFNLLNYKSGSLFDKTIQN